MRTQNFEALQSALNDEYVATQQNYDLRKNLLSEYQQAVMDSHWNTQQLLFDALNAGIDSMQKRYFKPYSRHNHTHECNSKHRKGYA